MNAPTHVLSGIALGVLAARFVPQTIPARTLLAAAAVCVGAALLHVGMDLQPHYNWIVYLHAFESLPYHWLVREAVCTLVVFIPALYLARRAVVPALAGVFGSVYPDIEKVAAVDFGFRHALFPGHSLELSTHDYGLPRSVLIASDFLLIATFFSIVWKFAPRRFPTAGTLVPAGGA